MTEDEAPSGPPTLGSPPTNASVPISPSGLSPWSPQSGTALRRTRSDADSDDEVADSKRQRRDEHADISHQEAEDYEGDGHDDEDKQDQEGGQDQDVDQSHEDEKEQEGNWRAQWAQLLNEQITPLILRRDAFLHDPVPPSIGQPTAVNPNLLDMTMQVGPPNLSTRARDLHDPDVEDRYPNQLAEDDAKLEVLVARARLYQIINQLASLEVNLGTVELDGDFAYNEARLAEWRYARVYTQGGPRAKDEVEVPAPRCSICYRALAMRGSPDPLCRLCALMKDNRDYLHQITFVNDLAVLTAGSLLEEPGGPDADVIQQGLINIQCGTIERDHESTPGMDEEPSTQLEQLPTTDNEDTDDVDTIIAASTSTKTDGLSAQRAALLHLARSRVNIWDELTPTDRGNGTDTDDNDSTMSDATYGPMAAPSPQRAALLRLARTHVNKYTDSTTTGTVVVDDIDSVMSDVASVR
ncbi:MAG: hypothetical protein Q9166_007203 [cf. Caloplaca sp. 2 TL-2023]